MYIMYTIQIRLYMVATLENVETLKYITVDGRPTLGQCLSLDLLWLVDMNEGRGNFPLSC